MPDIWCDIMYFVHHKFMRGFHLVHIVEYFHAQIFMKNVSLSGPKHDFDLFPYIKYLFFFSWPCSDNRGSDNRGSDNRGCTVLAIL